MLLGNLPGAWVKGRGQVSGRQRYGRRTPFGGKGVGFLGEAYPVGVGFEDQDAPGFNRRFVAAGPDNFEQPGGSRFIKSLLVQVAAE